MGMCKAKKMAWECVKLKVKRWRLAWEFARQKKMACECALLKKMAWECALTSRFNLLNFISPSARGMRYQTSNKLLLLHYLHFYNYMIMRIFDYHFGHIQYRNYSG